MNYIKDGKSITILSKDELEASVSEILTNPLSEISTATQNYLEVMGFYSSQEKVISQYICDRLKILGKPAKPVLRKVDQEANHEIHHLIMEAHTHNLNDENANLSVIDWCLAKYELLYATANQINKDIELAKEDLVRSL